ncbi:hypothetical protein ACP70R_012968 [Stipagrostis hirtigluma subsp. patula]
MPVSPPLFRSAPAPIHPHLLPTGVLGRGGADAGRGGVDGAVPGARCGLRPARGEASSDAAVRAAGGAGGSCVQGDEVTTRV